MDLSWDAIETRSPAAHAAANAAGSDAKRARSPLPPLGRTSATKLQSPTGSKSNAKSKVTVNTRRQVARWQRCCPLDPSRPEFGSWLLVENGAAACVVCPDFSASLKASTMIRHANSKAHRAAVSTVFCQGEVPGAPSETMFRAILDDRVAGKPYRQACQEAAAAKSARMTWCLGEALREDERRFFRSVVTVAIHQDAQGPKLCVVYSAASKTETRTGILGMAQHFGTDSKEIKAATLQIMKEACTRRLRPPRGAVCESTVDFELFSRLKTRVELFDTDGASDEQKTGRLLAGHDGPCGDFPNIKVQLQDKTHAATRLTLKPWLADPFLRETFFGLIRDRDSIASVIFKSDVFKRIFHARVAQTVDCPVDGSRITDMASAKHRFASSQKPVGRMILWLDAVIATAHEIVVRRKAGKREARSAVRFLDMVMDPDRLIVLAMMADAGDECSGLLRFFDSRFDVAETPHVISTFLHKIDCLFLRREVEKCSSYTAIMLKSLKERQRLVLSSGGFKAVGGSGFVTDDVMARCYSRMAAWVRLAAKTIAVEFPSWELLQAFGVFGLSPAPSESFVSESLARLAQTFGLNGANLANEFADFQRTAASTHDKSNGGALAVHSAWVGKPRPCDEESFPAKGAPVRQFGATRRKVRGILRGINLVRGAHLRSRQLPDWAAPQVHGHHATGV